MKKRGQITAFIIVGIVLFIGVGLGLYLIAISSQPSGDSFAPEEIVPVVRFIDNCLDTTTSEGLQKLGYNGGFITVPDEIKNTKYYHIGEDVGALPNQHIPIWHYAGENSFPCLYSDSETQMINLGDNYYCTWEKQNSIKNQIEKYVEDNIGFCLDNFSSFKNLYSVQSQNSPDATLDINEDDLVINLVYPLRITDLRGTKTRDWQDFNVKLPVRLKKIYQLAVDIVLADDDSYYLEQKTVELMNTDTSIPITESGLGSTKTWKVSDIKSELKQLISYSLLPHITIAGTSNVVDKTNVQGYLEDWNIGINNNIYKNTSVSFNFMPSWDFFLFQPRPLDSSGNYLLTTKTSGSGVDWQTTDYSYDLIYPTLIDIEDSASFGARGFRFRFGLPVMINHLNGDRTNFQSLSYNIVTQSSICDDTIGKKTVKIFDKLTQSDKIIPTSIVFECINQECQLGTTTNNQLVVDMPNCDGGILYGKADGYTSETISIDLEDNTYRIPLIPEHKLKINYVNTHDSYPAIISIAGGAYYNLIDTTEQNTLTLPYKDATYTIIITTIDNAGEVHNTYKQNWDVTSSEILTGDTINFYTSDDKLPKITG